LIGLRKLAAHISAAVCAAVVLSPEVQAGPDALSMRPLTHQSPESGRFASFHEFYPYYLAEHRDRTCRRLHFVGTSLVLIVLATAALTRNPWLLLLAPVAGYGFAWVGHFGFEKNRPATFTHPFYSLAADFVLFRDMLTGRIRF
jgi:hypothetical protein